ncbi:TPA: AAA family ATPase [Patescibacteria group bacterium]|uniref:Stalled replication fork rescue ATPase n=1 Tax=Candidatus Gottesmanbacteria bacterium GW2011_GWA1_43_11 TaxID=1618436 RepID=A0A0G1F9N9_9BACT|nr:MAG: Stalled replication fork rescue ATPase [Candidatus Gottesmanbacteria bacterium GW2011_GWA1_43_11]HCS78216.1 AAA family ATPase [Patescibacteria group bacterium]
MQFAPLAEQLRPKSFPEFIGQPHLVGQQGIITKLIASQNLPSLIFWGPPGSGKTTLAHLIAQKLDAEFIALSAVTAKLEEVRRVVKEAAERQKVYVRKTILFIDEIHRFNKAQQDAFLPHVEKGTVILIGATTENPSFEVIGPLLSRCRVLVLNELSTEELDEIINRTLVAIKRTLTIEAREFLRDAANGDARKLITTLEVAESINKKKTLTLADIEQAFQRKHLLYDTGGEEHYNTISAFIKSMRASQPDAALYYLARMVAAGEDPLFIARRMVVFASEDVGMAQPTALVVANEVFRACETIGYPECAINLAHGVVYLATAKKDRRAYDGLRTAQKDVNEYGNLPIPLHIRNAPTKLMKNLGYGKGYEAYTEESFLPEKLKGKKYYIQTNEPR